MATMNDRRWPPVIPNEHIIEASIRQENPSIRQDIDLLDVFRKIILRISGDRTRQLRNLRGRTTFLYTSKVGWDLRQESDCISVYIPPSNNRLLPPPFFSIKQHIFSNSIGYTHSLVLNYATLCLWHWSFRWNTVKNDYFHQTDQRTDQLNATSLFEELLLFLSQKILSQEITMLGSFHSGPFSGIGLSSINGSHRLMRIKIRFINVKCNQMTKINWI